MYLRSDQRPTGSRLALRIAVLGGVSVALFAVLFFRLWNLQVVSGEEYLAEAKNNRSREFKVIAPRGEILDREGNVLVENRTSLALQLNTQKLPGDPGAERAMLGRIADLAGMSMRKLRRTIREEEKVSAGAPVTLRKDVGYDLVYYLEENMQRFPGVSVQRVFVRRYPEGSTAAHLLGSVGEISGEELKQKRHRGLEPGDTVGKEGVEFSYDRFLRGQPGLTKIQVNALGQPTPGGRLVSRAPVPGQNLKLTIHPGVQAAGEAALSSYGLHGAFVSMNVNSGEVLGMGSFPTYQPSVLTKTLSQRQVNELYRDEVNAPLTNRATEGHYPVGSTFKVITALAALESGNTTIDESVFDDGEIKVGDQTFENAEGAEYGPVSLVRALEVSSDVYFYTLGLRMWDANILQRWAGRLGIGRPTGIDLPGESEGLVPSRDWRDELFADGETDRPWAAGDNIQLAIGQGDLQTNPLQLAVAYAALGNGGRLVMPRLGKEVEDSAGRVLKEFEPRAQGKVKINEAYRASIMQGLHAAAQGQEGTSADTFADFPVPVAGKTGTAERQSYADQAWYAVLAPYPDPRIVTVVTLEQGGFGSETAAPVARQILEAYFAKEIEAAAKDEEGGEAGEEVELPGLEGEGG